MSTISGTITHTVTLGVPYYASPLTITSTGDVSSPSDAGITSTAAGTVVNAGSVYGHNIGIYLGAGGSVTNLSGGTIVGHYSEGIAMGGAGTVVNAGSISSYADGVLLAAGGSVTNQSGGTISARDNPGIYIASSGGTVVNAGSVHGGYTGVRLLADAYVINQSGGSISADQNAVYIDSGTVVNTGSVYGDINGVRIIDGGSVTNQSGGVITSREGFALYIDQGAGTVVNAGSISGRLGVFLNSGGSVTNLSGGTITGGVDGIDISLDSNAAGTVVNAGSVYGFTYGVELNSGGSVTNQSGGTIGGRLAAVVFDAGHAANLTVDPGARFTGAVYGGNAIGSATVSTLELASGASTGTLTGIGSQFTNFGSIVFDPDAAWLLSGNSAGLAENSASLGPVIDGFAVGDTIDLTGFSAVSDSFANHGLVLANSTGTDVTIDFAGNYAADAFQISSDGNGGTDIVACFLPGTHILTDRGEIEVETLQPGDTIMTASGGTRRLCWIGQGKALAARGRRGPATPLIVRKGALADNVPHRDLHVTKGHSLYLDGVLIPVEFLVNHRSILWDDHAQEVTVYHLELDRHDVLLAEGAPAESYRDDGNRWLFQNANPGWEQPAQPPCAQVLTGGPVVDAAWRRLLDRSGPRAKLRLTDDPDLHLLADGQRVEATSRLPGVYVFSLRSVPNAVRIVSRRVVPQELGLARDARELGVALRSVLVRKGAKFRTAKAHDPRLVSGFHPYEAADHLIWTDGGATIPADLLDGFSGQVEVVLTLAGATQYVDDGARRRVA